MSLPAKHYTHQPAAQALFFRGPRHGNQALRIACQPIAREFTDNSYIGTDPEGILYYNDISDISGNCNYKVQRQTDAYGYIYAHVFFYQSTVGDAFAEFVGQDPTEAVNTAQMDGYEYYGTWQELNATQTPAAVTRQSGSNTVTVILDPDHPKNFPNFKKATVPVSGDVTLSLNSLDNARGNFTFKDTYKLTEGVYANWTSDRIVFYDSDYLAKDWVGFFIPNEGVDIGNPVPSTGVFSNVTWGPL